MTPIEARVSHWRAEIGRSPSLQQAITLFGGSEDSYIVRLLMRDYNVIWPDPVVQSTSSTNLPITSPLVGGLRQQ